MNKLNEDIKIFYNIIIFGMTVLLSIIIIMCYTVITTSKSYITEDVDRNGIVNIKDLLKVQKYIVERNNE